MSTLAARLPALRKKLEALAWKSTKRGHRGNSTRSIMFDGHLRMLADLADLELIEQLTTAHHGVFIALCRDSVAKLIVELASAKGLAVFGNPDHAIDVVVIERKLAAIAAVS